ncbi:MAG: glutamyl-tRNA reductase [Sedimentisphaerales bacterium]|nr:glutamyl-tRNA reductase [Sedimentisphaerales bacterium]
MKIFVLGLNHKSAPLAILEKLAFDSEQTLQALKMLRDKFEAAEFALLSTCNRVELYCACNRTEPVAIDDVIEFLSDFHNIPREKFQEHLYLHNNEDAARHLLTVTSSLDSLIVGEAQIIGQVKECYRLACSASSTGKVLNRLFHCAFATGKKVHTTTSIAQGRVSVAGVAVELVKRLFDDISSANAVVIGAGEMGELLVQHLIKIGCGDINIINRSYNRASLVARHHSVTASKWQDMPEQLKNADVVIACAAVKDYLYTKKTFQKIIDGRKKQTLLIIDIAVPRNFEPSISEIDNVHLYSIDDLSEIAGQNRKAREQDIATGMKIIHDDVNSFMDWLGAREIGPMIGQLEEKFVQISRQELERFFVGIRQEAPCREVLETAVGRIVNKLLHCVIKNVDKVAKESGTTEAAKLVDSIVRQAEAITSESCGKKDLHP